MEGSDPTFGVFRAGKFGFAGGNEDGRYLELFYGRFSIGTKSFRGIRQEPRKRETCFLRLLQNAGTMIDLLRIAMWISDAKDGLP